MELLHGVCIHIIDKIEVIGLPSNTLIIYQS